MPCTLRLRIDTNKVPSELKKAWQLMEEEAVAKNNPSGFISKNQKRDVKDSINKKMEEDLRSGKFRRSKLLPILWDLQTQTVFCSATGKSFETLAEIFERSFGLELQPLTSGSLGLRLVEEAGGKRAYEDMRPRDSSSAPKAKTKSPIIPGSPKEPSRRIFLATNFCSGSGTKPRAAPASSRPRPAMSPLFIDKSLDLDCAYGQTGKDTLRGDGPSRMPEAKDALRSGKLPRKVGLVLDMNGQQFALTLGGDSLAIGGAKLPDVEEAESPRVLFEERIALLRDLCKLVDGLYETFLKLRTSGGWESQAGVIRRWIVKLEKAAAAA